jgi:nicotinate-nucleotide adenylyltransferase
MIGIFGGTFDPVHHAHLATLEHVQEELALDSVFLVPLGQAVHREPPIASAQRRYEMLLLAVAQQQNFVVDDREITNSAPSYTIDTVKSFSAQMPYTPLALIIGSDAFNAFHQWRDPHTILKLANLVVMQRPTHPISDAPETRQFLEQYKCADKLDFIQSPAGKILPLKVPQMAISSTEIRSRIKNGDDITEMTPPSVSRLIRLHDLYSD